MSVRKEILDEAYPIIENIAKSRSSRGSFAYYENCDVFQEVWSMCLEAMERYDPEIGPIENYLTRHVSNRIKNLKRDKYFRPGFNISTSGMAKTRMNLVNALPIDGGDIAEQGTLLCSSPLGTDPVDHLLCTETLEYIREKLPENLSESFEALISNNKVRSPLLDDVRQKVAEILSDRDNDVG